MGLRRKFRRGWRSRIRCHPRRGGISNNHAASDGPLSRMFHRRLFRRMRYSRISRLARFFDVLAGLRRYVRALHFSRVGCLFHGSFTIHGHLLVLRCCFCNITQMLIGAAHAEWWNALAVRNSCFSVDLLLSLEVIPVFIPPLPPQWLAVMAALSLQRGLDQRWVEPSVPERLHDLLLMG